MRPNRTDSSQGNPLIHDLISGNSATLFFLSEPDSIWMRDTHAAIAISRAIPWGTSRIHSKPIVSRTPRLFLKEEIESINQKPGAKQLLEKLYANCGTDQQQFENELDNYISLMLEMLVSQQSDNLQLPTFKIPPEGNIWIIGRPELYNFRNRGDWKSNSAQDWEQTWAGFLKKIGYLARFRFMESNHGKANYRTIIDEQTGIKYTPDKCLDSEGIFQNDYGIIFKTKIDIYSPRYVTILAGSSTLGTWGCAEFATNSELWKSVKNLSAGKEIDGVLELLIHTKPDTALCRRFDDSRDSAPPKTSMIHALNNSEIELTAQTTDFPSIMQRSRKGIKTAGGLIESMRGRENALTDTVHPSGALATPLTIESVEILPMVGSPVEGVEEPIDSYLKKLVCSLDSVKNPTPVLILGERGTGKELVAGLIAYFRLQWIGARPGNHLAGFSETNCSTFSPGLADSELFGYVKGAFTHSNQQQDRPGVIKEAGYGVCFLDEFGDLPPEQQPKLLRMLANRTIRPVGADKSEPYFAKIVAATNRIELLSEAENSTEPDKFRGDLLSRFPHSQRLHLKPLRERKEDIVPLTVYWLQKKFNDLQDNGGRTQGVEQRQLHRVHIEENALKFLLGYHYPSNVRTLFDILDEINFNAALSEIRDTLLPEITLNFGQIPGHYITREFQKLETDQADPVYFTFIPESPFSSGMEIDSSQAGKICRKMESELKAFINNNGRITAEELQVLADTSEFSLLLRQLSSRGSSTKKDEVRSCLAGVSGGVFGSIKKVQQMANKEKGKLLNMPGWVNISDTDTTLLFRVKATSTIGRWKKQGLE